MAFCAKCGAQLNEGAKFCPSCGAVTPAAADPSEQHTYQQQSYQQQSYQQPQYAADPRSDAEQNKAMGILAYIGILVLIPIFAAKESPFARYHSNQGLVLCLAAIAYSIAIAILNAIFWAINFTLGSIMSTLFSIASLGFLALAIIGIINASKGEMKPLPIIGGIKILK